MASRGSFTAHSFQLTLQKLSGELERARKEHEERVRSSSAAEATHGKAEAKLKILKAQAFLAAEGPVAEREAKAEVAVEDEAFELADLKAALSLEIGLKISAWGAIESAQARMSALQSLASAYKAEPQ